ncbi:MAG: hypothetical protein DWQ37_13335 [Planctomycetota bacterium]|nr:MAG: hypothetical protein DWQ37_13335 [Planctomycetota bacterium]
MRCDEFQSGFNAWTDRELPEEQAAELEAHLAECAACQAAAEALQAIDGELRTAFAPRRRAAAQLADRVVLAVHEASTATPSPSPPAQQPTGLAWPEALSGVAAGFLLAAAVFRPWRDDAAKANAAVRQPIARMAAASGPVEVQMARHLPVFTCPPAAPIARDSIVRTGPTARCELTMKDGNALRLDCNTEVKLHGSEAVEVHRGRLFAISLPESKRLKIQSGGGTITPQGAARFAVDCQRPAVRLTVVDGMACVQTSNRSRQVGPGKQVRIVEGRVEDDPEARDALLETAWVTGVIALRGADHPELVERVNRLLAKVGAAKLSLLYEEELRRLGDDGVPPLLAYLAATRDTPQVQQRATAARIVADVAEARRIAELIALLTDANADVRFHAARGLERLTGRNQGLDAKTWQSGPWLSCEGPYEKWRTWWAANHDRYPAAKREIPTPNSAPF